LSGDSDQRQAGRGQHGKTVWLSGAALLLLSWRVFTSGAFSVQGGIITAPT